MCPLVDTHQVWSTYECDMTYFLTQLLLAMLSRQRMVVNDEAKKTDRGASLGRQQTTLHQVGRHIVTKG